MNLDGNFPTYERQLEISNNTKKLTPFSISQQNEGTTGAFKEIFFVNGSGVLDVAYAASFATSHTVALKVTIDDVIIFDGIANTPNIATGLLTNSMIDKDLNINLKPFSALAPKIQNGVSNHPVTDGSSNKCVVLSQGITFKRNLKVELKCGVTTGIIIQGGVAL